MADCGPGPGPGAWLAATSSDPTSAIPKTLWRRWGNLQDGRDPQNPQRSSASSIAERVGAERRGGHQRVAGAPNAAAMRRREPMQLTNGRANPLDEFNATLPGLDNVLPMLPQSIPGTRVSRGKGNRTSSFWTVNIATETETDLFKLNITQNGRSAATTAGDEAWRRDIIAFAGQHAGGGAAPMAAPAPPMVREVDDDGCRAAGTGQIGELSERVSMGLSVNAIDSVRGCTLLMHAALGNGGSSSQLTCVEFLLSQDADIEARSTRGDTALILAALCGHVDAVDLLLQAGASAMATGSTGMTALQCAETRKQGEFDFQPGKAAVAALLRECGV